MTNHGLLNDPRVHFSAGIIPFVERNSSGNWTNYLPDGERQSNGITDTMACVSFSLINSIQTQEFYLTGKKIKYSKRWLAKLSGTTPSGNYFKTVADTVALYGLVREESWPVPQNYTWQTYYADPDLITRQNLLAEGTEWLKTHKLQSEFLTTSLSDILQHIKQCPLQIGVPGHAIENFYTQQEVINYFDSYIPFTKQTSRTALTDVYKNVLTIKQMRLVNDNNVIYLVGDKGKLGFADMESLTLIQSLTSEPIENGSTAGTPQIRIMEKGFTVHS